MLNTLIAAAVAPLEVIAMDKAEAAARVRIAYYEAKLKEADWNLDAIAARPCGNMDRATYRTAANIRSFVGRFTASDPARRTFRFKDPTYVVMDPAGAERLILEVRQLAKAHYEAFVAKLTEKVGAGIASATLATTSGVWDDSILTVAKEDGTLERWQTKIITNHSVYGLPFNQWPTRKVK